jgi:hypothetical protein
MVKRTASDQDIQEALQVLEAIQALQRWLLEQPMGADALYLSPTNLVLVHGQAVVASVALSHQCHVETA